MRKKIVALDPGKTTGVAVGYIETDLLAEGGYPAAQCSEASNMYEILMVLESEQPDVVVYETFNLRPVPGINVAPVELIGAVKAWCMLNRKVHHGQTPQSRHVIDVEKGLAIKGPHMRDALQHFRYYARRVLNG